MKKMVTLVPLFLLFVSMFTVIQPKVEAFSNPYLVDVGISYEETSTPITPPITQTPGGHMRLWYHCYNPNSYTVDVILGASIKISSSYYDDPARDKTVTLQPGNNNPNRYFHVPSGVPTGSYTVIYAIWASDWSVKYDEETRSGWVNMVSSVAVQLSSFPSNVGTITWDCVTYSLPKTVYTTTRIHWSGSDCIHCTPPSGYEFEHWEATGAVDLWDEYSQSTSVSVDGDGSLTAVFTGDGLTTIKVDPNGGKIHVDGDPIYAMTQYEWLVGSTHTLDPVSGYSPSDGKKLLFTQWSDGNTADPRTVTVTETTHIYTAQWQTQYRLNIDVDPPEGGTTNPSPGTYWHNPGSSVTVIEGESEGYNFHHWDLDGNSVGSRASYTVTMNTPHVLTAFFIAEGEEPDFTLSISPGSKTVVPGESATFTVAVISLNGFNSPVTLYLRYSAIPLSPHNYTLTWWPTPPPKHTYSFDPNPASPPPDGFVESILTIETYIDTEPGTYNWFYVEGYENTPPAPSKISDWFTLTVEPAQLYVKLVSSDDDYHSVNVYVDGEFWDKVGSNPRQTDYSEDIGVSTGQHTVEIRWHDDDTDTYYERSSDPKQVNTGELVEFEFDIVGSFFAIGQVGPNQFSYITSATLAYAGDSCYVYAEEGTSLSYEQAEDIATEFDNIIYPKEVTLFGNPNGNLDDVDGDPHVYILFLYAKHDHWYMGMFYPPNEYEEGEAPAGLPTNEKEMLYLDNTTLFHEPLKAYIAHEFTHLIEYNYDHYDSGLEELWVSEGLANYAMHAVYNNYHPWDHIDDFLTHPDTTLTESESDQYGLANYGCDYLYFLYLWEIMEYAGYDGASIIRSILQDTANGIGGIDNNLPSGYTFEIIFSSEWIDWTIANYYDADVKPYGYESIDIKGKVKDHLPLHEIPHNGYLQSPIQDISKWAADYERLSTQGSHMEISFYGDTGPSFEAKIVLTKDGQSLQIINIPLSDNEGSWTIEEANEYTEILFVIVRKGDSYDSAEYYYTAHAYSPGITVTAESPINLLVTDPNGRRVGYDPETKSVVNEIPNATYSGPGSEPQEITIPNPLTGNYTVDAFGIGSGAYTITMQSIASNGSIIDNDTWQGMAVPDEQYSETVRLDPEGRLIWPYDIEVTNLLSSKTVIGQGYCTNITVTITNWGDFTQSFNVSVFYDDTIIILPDGKNYTTTTLTSGDSTTLTITWNTTGVAKGNYTITAKATPLPYETDTLDNTLTDGIVTVTIPGDVDGDFDVDLYDAVAVCAKYGFKKGHPEYDPNCDINNNGQIFLYDAVIVGANYGKSWD